LKADWDHVIIRQQDVEKRTVENLKIKL